MAVLGVGTGIHRRAVVGVNHVATGAAAGAIVAGMIKLRTFSVCMAYFCLIEVDVEPPLRGLRVSLGSSTGGGGGGGAKKLRTQVTSFLKMDMFTP